MSKAALNAQAPDFILDDFEGRAIRLSDYRGRKIVVLVLNRGFM